MIEANKPDNENVRLKRLYELGILDTLEEQAYDDLTKLAAEICKTPIALVSLIDRNRQWFKSHHGLDARETPREFAFCAHAILDNETMIIEDSDKDQRFHDNPLATGAPYVKFYAGAPLIMSDNIKLGTLCVIGNEARTITKHQQDALEALARQVVSQLELRLKLKESELLDQAKDDFIATVSHELRTPLTAIYGSLAPLQNNQLGELEDKQKETIAIAYRNTERLLSLVNDILDLAKLESGRMELQIKVLDIAALLVKSIELNEPYCKTCHVELALNILNKDDTFLVNADESKLLQVLSNLISNAAKFSRDNDTIEIRLSNDDEFVVVEITDHGPGIPAEHQDLLFKKFRQLDTKINQKLPGTGLGLNISKNIIELHQGSIGFTSIPNTETTFYIKIPRIAGTNDRLD